ncbi:MAG TPA: 3'-5' exonuclease [Saprospiraceae bacterium]|nr:3'-5' exonuclease [Saprospiraceae bacterium]
MSLIKKISERLGFSQEPKLPVPDFYKPYMALFEKKEDENTLLSKAEYAIIDSEATGLDLEKDEIISIGGVTLINQSIDISQSISFYIKGRKISDREAPALHGILPDQPFGMDEFSALEALINFIGNKIIVGHYIGFDLKMINLLLKKYGAPPLKNKVLDTAELTKRLDFPLRNYQFAVNKEYTLDALCARYGVIPKARHTAAGDAYITAILFQKLLSDLDKKGISQVKDLKR